ncbi:hypothetical protein BDK51DRAFT_43331, partial [Blyttiomyces helicus]
MNPELTYKPTDAFAMLSLYPNHVISSALQSLRDSGVVVKTKTGNDRKVPGRNFMLSD